jgi:uncharacterized protein (DUF1501 family)
MPPWDVSRRVFLKGAGLLALGVGAEPSSLLVRMAEAAGAGSSVLVKVFLRGGADGLNLCAPYGDSEYYDLRGDIALPRPGASGGLVNLDGFFGLHPALAPLKPLYDERRLALVHAVGSYGLGRSHFAAQDFTETGTPGVPSTPTGWLDRTIARIPGASVTEAVAFSALLPRSFLGPEPLLVVEDLESFDLMARNWREEADVLVRALYQTDGSATGTAAREAFAAIDSLRSRPEIQAPPANGAQYPDAPVGRSLRQAAQVLKAGLGTRCVYVNVTGGFDTHANQLAANASDYGALGSALAAFDLDLGGRRDDVVVLVTTEFGRTAAVNGSQGTDHGTGHCMMVLGGRVRGGRVAGSWPGLSRSQLFEERDLAVTTDYRDVYAELARVHLGITDAATLFPGYTPGPGPGVV